MSGNEFRFFLSCDINLPVTFRIERLEGNLPPISNTPNSGIFFYYFNFFLKKFSEEDEVWVNELSSAFEVSLSPILLLLFFYAEVNSTTEDRRAELYVECTLYIDGAPFGLPTRTRFYPFAYSSSYVVYFF